MSDDPRTIEALRQRLQRAVNRVPERVQNGSVQATREWMDRREEAVRLLKKNPTATQLLSMLGSLE